MAKKFDAPTIEPQRDQSGAITGWWFVHDGRRWPLPGAPGSKEWRAETRRLSAETSGATTRPARRKVTAQRRSRGAPFYLLVRLNPQEAHAVLSLLDFIASKQMIDANRRIRDAYDVLRVIEPLTSQPLLNASRKIRLSLAKYLDATIAPDTKKTGGGDD